MPKGKPVAFDTLEVQEECRKVPGFERGTAFTRTKIACDVLVKRGEAIPSWERLREIIERGSSGDISRGVRTYREEHAEMLSKLGGAGQGVPEALGHAFRQLWEQAVTTARQEFVEAGDQMKARVAAAEAATASAAAVSAGLEGRVRELLAQLDAAAAAHDALRVQVEAERAAKEQAERMFEKNAAEIAAQRDELRDALAAAQADWRKSLDRLDAERKHAMLQIEEARTKAKNDVETARLAAQRAREDAEHEAARSSAAMQDMRQRLLTSEARNAAYQQEAQDLRARLTRAEAQTDALTAVAPRSDAALEDPRHGARRIRPARGAGKDHIRPVRAKSSR
jgi:chromosome segregation ATPase